MTQSGLPTFSSNFRDNRVGEIRTKQEIAKIGNEMRVCIDFLARATVPFEHALMGRLEPARIVVRVVPVLQTFLWYRAALVQGFEEGQNRSLVCLIGRVPFIMIRVRHA